LAEKNMVIKNRVAIIHIEKKLEELEKRIYKLEKKTERQ
jgi:hypothetical protein